MKYILSAVFVLMVGWASYAEQTSKNNEDLKNALKRYPRADLNGDGVLTETEAKKAKERSQQRKGQKQNKKKDTGKSNFQVPDNLVLKEITYREGEFKRAWTLNLVYEKGNTEVRPGIVFIHGGGWKNGDKAKFTAHAIEYAKRGYVCISTSYRLTNEKPFPAAVEDVKNAVRWFRKHADEYHLDPNNIGAYGNSAGAHLVSMLGLVKKEDGLEGDGTCLDTSSAVQAVAASATPTDFFLFKKPGANTEFLAGPEDKLEERAKKASPITYVRADAPPFMLFHGTADTTVDVAHSDNFVKALKDAGVKDVTYIRVDGANHGVFGQDRPGNYDKMDEFFARTLKK